MEKWAREINILEYEDNEIGRIKNIGLATIQHFRMDFGVDTVKPDQRVIEVLENEFKAKKVSQGKAIALVEEIAKITNISVRELDLVMVNYGSGYYENIYRKSKKEIITNIAIRLKDKNIEDSVIEHATGLSLKKIESLSN